MRILVIDDDRLVAISLKTILESSDPEIKVVALGGSGKEAIFLYEELHPDVILMDIRMEGMTGLEAGEKILEQDPEARILYLTTFADDEYIIKALNMGAKGYILKQDFDGIAPALSAVMNGQSVFGERIITKIPELLKPREDGSEYDFAAHGISDKEREILELVAEGLSNKEIAGRLYLGDGTVRNYVSALLEKLELRDRTQLAIYYYTEIKKH